MCFVCAMAAPPHLKEQPIGEWFIFTAMTAFWVSLILLVSWTSFLKLQLLIPLCWYRCHIGKRHQTSLYKRWLLFFCSGNVLGACNRKVPCHPLADDRVRLLCALVLLLLYSSSCFCSEGGGYIICEQWTLCETWCEQDFMAWASLFFDFDQFGSPLLTVIVVHASVD